MFQIEFWGVRGSVPCANKEYELYGGNTSCVCVMVNNNCIILDAGTGIFPLGKWIQKQQIKQASLFISHAHFDHIIGLPFFAPLWDEQFKLDIYAGIFTNHLGIQGFFEKYLNHPLFPGNLKEMAKAKLCMHDIAPASVIQLQDNITIETINLNHPGGSSGYKISYNGKSLCYITDVEHLVDQTDRELLNFIQETDCLIYDTMYLPEEHKDKIGWGHSTWKEAIAISKKANVKRLCAFHLNPDHTDPILQELENSMIREFEHAQIARQGLKITF